MKTIKPQKLGVLARVVDLADGPVLVVSLLAMFPLVGASGGASRAEARRLLDEATLWKLWAERGGPEGVLDAGMPKPRAEVLVTGRCFTAGGKPQIACAVRLALGPVDKTVYVVGDRQWRHGVATDPVPFTEMPLGWERSFGGPSVPDNPLGRGAQPVDESGATVHRLPNVEDPKALVRSPKDRPLPVGLGALDFTWPQRQDRRGTYDDAWLKERFPGFARDLDLALFSTAPLDQRVEGFFAGDESFVLEHLHRDHARLEGRLPELQTRCLLRERLAEGERVREVPTRLDTVHLFPDAERAILIWRGVARVEDDDASSVLTLLAACEAREAPRSRDHYEAVLAARLDKKTGALHALRDGDLLPEPSGAAPIAEEREVLGQLLRTEQLLAKRQRRRAEVELARAKDDLRARGLNPDAYTWPELPPEPAPAPADADLAAVVEEAMSAADAEAKKADVKRAELEAKARKACADAKVPYRGSAERGGPPRFSADAELARLRASVQDARRRGGVISPEAEAQLADPQHEAKLRRAEAELLMMYRRTAHLRGPAERAEGDAARKRVREAREHGASLRGVDLTGADLAGEDLSGLDLTDALLERVNLRGADLCDARLAGVVLAHATLAEARLSRAQLAGANLGAADLSGARLDGADLTAATLARADLRGAVLSGARLVRADLSEAQLARADLTGLFAPELVLIGVDLSGARLVDAELGKATFVDVVLDDADLSGARLVSTTLVGIRASRARFLGAMAPNLRCVKDAKLDGACFDRAVLTGSCLRGADLASASLARADLTGSDLSEACLRSAKLPWAKLIGALLIRADLSGASLMAANLMQAVLQRAALRGADLSGANLFRADLLHVAVDQGTKVDGALLVQARVVQRDGGLSHGQR